jgi:hypothetical protein
VNLDETGNSAKKKAEMEELMRWKTFGVNLFWVLEAFCGGFSWDSKFAIGKQTRKKQQVNILI